MFKVAVLILALAIGASAVQDASDPEASPEPYSYQYDAGSHSASESKDASGKVTGFYTVSDADGRQRRVDYEADAAGFRAKVQTNEVGTKSENSADVEVVASPPNEEQLVASSQYQQSSQYLASQASQQQASQQQASRFGKLAGAGQQSGLYSSGLRTQSVYGGYQAAAPLAGSSSQYSSYGYGYAPAGATQGYGQGYSQRYGQGYYAPIQGYTNQGYTNQGYYGPAQGYNQAYNQAYYKQTSGAVQPVGGAVQYSTQVVPVVPAAGGVAHSGLVGSGSGGSSSGSYRSSSSSSSYQSASPVAYSSRSQYSGSLPVHTQQVSYTQ